MKMNENTAEEAKKLAKEKAEQAKKLAAEKLEQVKNISADEAKEMANEKAEQTKKLAAEKLEQVKNISADEANAMAEEKIKKFKQLTMVKKVGYAAAEAVFLLVAVSITSGGGVELVEFDGDCPGNGELITNDGDKQHICQFTNENDREYSVRIPVDSDLLKSSSFLGYNGKNWVLLASERVQSRNNKISLSENFDINFDETKARWSSLLTKAVGYHDNGKVSSERLYVVKQDKSGEWNKHKTEDRTFNSNGKVLKENKFDVKQTEKGSWNSAYISQKEFYKNGKIKKETVSKSVLTSSRLVSLPTKDIGYYDNGKMLYETLYEVKEVEKGSIEKASLSKKRFSSEGKLSYEELCEVKVSKGEKEKNVLKSIPVKISSYYGGQLTSEEISEAHIDTRGRWKGFLKYAKKMKSEGHGKNKKYVVESENTYAVKHNANKHWQSLPLLSASYKLEKNSYARDSYYVTSSAEYTIKEHSSGGLVSLVSKKTIDSRKYRAKAPRGASVSLSGKWRWHGGGTKAETLYAMKKDDSGNWRSLMTEENRIGASSTTKTMYELVKNTSGSWQSLRVSAVSKNKDGKVTNETKYVIKTNDDDKIGSLRT